MVVHFFVIIAIIVLLFFGWFAIVSFREKEMLAVRRSAICMLVLPIPFILISNLPQHFVEICFWISVLLMISMVVLFFVPQKKAKETNKSSATQIDERITMFSRKEITRHPEKSKAYYDLYPEHKELDEAWKSKPGLLSPKSSMYNAKMYAAADASFSVIEGLRNQVSPKSASELYKGSASEFTSFVKQWGTKLGALDIGICEMKPDHFYSHRGRGEVYGKKVENNHKYGIALIVEMNKHYLATGPAAPTVMESAQQYLNSGTIALQLAHFIANMGYSARAHIDGNYEVVCPLVARDAGLGEIGRMGLLMTPTLGPRVRIAVVTTDMPLMTDKPIRNSSVQDFCNICKKCAAVCPSQAIPICGKKEINGVLRWQINQEKCFGFWCTSGTDCGRCMSVCPYSHPDNVLHNMVRWGIGKSWIFRRVALWMDDFFYGRKPKTKFISSL